MGCETDPADPPRISRGSAGLGALVTAGLLALIGWQLANTSTSAIAVLTDLPWSVAVSFALLYLTQPLADLIIYRRIWSLPLSGFGALLRKTAINEAVLGYGGELYLYLWARRRRDLAGTAFAGVKDVNVVSAMVGFALTFAVLGLALAGAQSSDLERLLRPLLWPALAVVAVALGALAFARRVFSLGRGDLAFVAKAHALRLFAVCGLTILTWSLALPDVALDVWIILLAMVLVGARIPFVTNTGLLVANAVLLLFGPDSSFGVLLAAMALATLALHLAVIAGLGFAQIRRWSRAMARGGGSLT